MDTVTIQFHRFNKPAVLYREGLVNDNGIRLHTFSSLSADIGNRLAAGWIAQGLLQPDAQLCSVRKYLFYQEYFTILELGNLTGEVLGYYCDIATPLERQGDNYIVHDLLLDLWVFPGGSTRELDWDEFLACERSQQIDISLAQIARRTLARLVDEAASGQFPQAYLD